AVLLRARWPEMFHRASAEHPISLVDPMCGSGTLLIEAAMMAADIAPGIWRENFGFHAWKFHDPNAWRRLSQEAIARRESGLRHLKDRVAHIVGADIDPHAIRAATDNIEMAGLSEYIHVEQQHFQDLRKPEPVTRDGLVITNAPYGERLERDGRAVELHERFGQALSEHFGGWRASLL